MIYRLIKCLFFIVLLLLFVISAIAQKSISGTETEFFEVKDGKFSIHHSVYLPKGKTISGTVISEPESEKQNKKQKQTENLQKYIIKLAGEIISSDGIFSLLLPDKENIPLQLFSSEGNLLEEISLVLSEPSLPLELKLPKIIRKNYTEKITGSFSGNITEVKVIIDEIPTDLIAGNESELFFESADNEPGKHELSLEYDEVKASETVNLIDYSLQAGRMTLNRGESTFLNIKIVGLEDLQEPLILEVENQSIGKISLEGGDQQTIHIVPEDLADLSTWEKRIDILSLTRGNFSVFTNLEIPEKKNEETENPDNVWENIELVGTQAKILKKNY